MSKPRALSDLVPVLTKDILGKRSMLFGKLMANWPHVAGPDIANKTIPLDLKFTRKANQKSQATLHLAVQSAYALEISYQKALLIERLNMFFGYPAIKEVKIVQHNDIMGKDRSTAATERPLTLQEEKNLGSLVAKIQENDLQTALKNLGKAIISRH